MKTPTQPILLPVSHDNERIAKAHEELQNVRYNYSQGKATWQEVQEAFDYYDSIVDYVSRN